MHPVVQVLGGPHGLAVAGVANAVLGALGVAVGLLTTPRRRWVGLLLALGGLAVPLLATGAHVGLRCTMSLGSAWIVLRAWDLAEEELPLRQRVWHVFAVFDTRLARPKAPETSTAKVLGQAGGLLVVTGALLWAALQAPWTPIRWALGALAVVVDFEAATRGIRGLHLCFGIEPPVLQDRPWRAQSTGELWGQRWNLVVHRILVRRCFKPVARRAGVPAGLLAAFAASAVLHGWIGWSLGPVAAGLLACFFLAQAPVVMLERELGIERWPRAAARLWTLAWGLGLSPLFVEPLLRAFEGGW